MKVSKSIIFVGVLICVGLAFWGVVQNGRVPVKATYSEFLQQVQTGQVTKVVIVTGESGPNPITYSLKDGSRERTMLPPDYRDVLATLRQRMVNIEIRDAASQWLHMLPNAMPFFVLLAFWFFMMWHLRHRAAK
jgi:cell division protease FtsH